MITARKFFLKHFDKGKNTIPEVMRLYAQEVVDEREKQIADFNNDALQHPATIIKSLPELELK